MYNRKIKSHSVRKKIHLTRVIFAEYLIFVRIIEVVVCRILSFFLSQIQFYDKVANISEVKRTNQF